MILLLHKKYNGNTNQIYRDMTEKQPYKMGVEHKTWAFNPKRSQQIQTETRTIYINDMCICYDISNLLPYKHRHVWLYWHGTEYWKPKTKYAFLIFIYVMCETILTKHAVFQIPNAQCMTQSYIYLQSYENLIYSRMRHGSKGQ